MPQIITAVHLVGFSACLFVAALLLAYERRAPANRALRLLMLVGAAWSLHELCVSLPSGEGHELALARIIGAFRLAAPFALFNFACAFSGRRRDGLWIALAAASAAAAALYFATDLGVISASRGPLGAIEEAGPFRWAFDGLDALTAICAAWVAYRGYAAARGPALRYALLSITAGVLVAVATATLADAIGSALVAHRFSIASVGFTVFIPFVSVAILRHGFLSADIAKASVELFADAKDGIVILDRYDRVRQMNPAAFEMFHASADGVIGVKAADVLPAWRELDAHGKAETEVRGADGEGRRLALSLSTPLRRGRRFGRFLLVRDVTERTLAREALSRSREELEIEVERRAAELEIAQRTEAMGALIGSIAHDFNNLLAAILGFATAARDDLPERHAVRRDLDEILSAARKARDTVNHLLAFGRQGAARRAPVEVGELLETTLSFVETSLPVSIALVRPALQEKIFVMGDATQLHQVIVNLTMNAAQAIGERRGTISVTTRPFHFGAEAGSSRRPIDPGETIVVTVTDDGPGIKREQLEHVFDPFFAAEGKGEGSGLGLSTAQRIARDHGGTITVESEEGKGASFSVFLPLIASRGDAEALEGSTATGSERILLIDADPQSSRKTRRSLVSLGYRVTVHADPRDAVAEYRKKPGSFDAAIVRMELQGTNGLDVAAQMLEERADAAILVVAAHLEPELMQAARRLHVATVVGKVASLGVLASTLRRMLDAAPERASQPSPR
jgi:signal transduction histidine kinase